MGELKVYVVEHPDVMAALQRGRFLFVCAATPDEAASYLALFECTAKQSTPASTYAYDIKKLITRCLNRDSFFEAPNYTPRGVIPLFETIDRYGQQLILKNENGAVEQVMMEWEREYMQACVNHLSPYGDVLELGFGLGYSATHIINHQPKSYTVIECDKGIHEKAKQWGSAFDNVRVVHGRWQDVLASDKYDCIFFDTFEPHDMQGACAQYLGIVERAGKDVCRLGYYLSVSSVKMHERAWGNAIASANHYNYELSFKPFETAIPDNCTYASKGSLYTAVAELRR